MIVNYPPKKEQFLEELLISKIPGELLSNCNLDSNFFHSFSHHLGSALSSELFTNVKCKETKKASGLIEFRVTKSTPRYDKLNEIKKEVDYYYRLLVDRMNNPMEWANRIKIDGTPCCEPIQSILNELKDKFNPNFSIYITFFKCFYYHSLTDFDNFHNEENHIPTILQQAIFFTGDLKIFFFKKVLEDVNRKNQKFKYAERLLKFNSDFKEIIDIKDSIQAIKAVHKSDYENRPTHTQIALKYRYLLIANLHNGITDSNKQEIAIKYEWTAKNSGHNIYQKFIQVYSTDSRTNKSRTTISNLEAVIIMLEDYPKAKAIAMDELETAKSKG